MGFRSVMFYGSLFAFNVSIFLLIRFLLAKLRLTYRKKAAQYKRVVFFTNGTERTQLPYTDPHQYGCEAVGVIAVNGHRDHGDFQMEANRVCHGREGLYLEAAEGTAADFLMREAVDEALLNLPGQDSGELNEIIALLQRLGILAHVTTDTFGLEEQCTAAGEFGPYHVLSCGRQSLKPEEQMLKRLMDIAGGAVGAICTLLLGVFVVPAIRLESPGPAIFKQVRIGRNGRRFYMFKFRSMYMDAEDRKKSLMEQNEMIGPIFKIQDDPRITRVGKFIRRTSIDEFPQFFNVLAGDMSLVGTRPPTEDEFLQYSEHHKRRLSLKPGITGLWQVTGRSGIKDFEDIVKLDLEYIDHWSLWLDLKILLETVCKVLFHKGAA